MSGDGNIEDLFGIFPSTDADAGDVWGTCIHFVEHLHWHKPRKTALIPKNGGIPDDHPTKPRCLLCLS